MDVLFHNTQNHRAKTTIRQAKLSGGARLGAPLQIRLSPLTICGNRP
jgi:hypothetical protein